MRRMTLAEKVAQLGSRWVGVGPLALGAHEGSDAAESPDPIANVAPMQDVFALGGKGITGGGEPRRPRTSDSGLRERTGDPAQGAAELVRQQRVVLNASRLGIPALVHEECLTGFTTYGATVYPAAIAWAATFDPALVERMAAAIRARHGLARSAPGFVPVVDVVRDYRWGRVEETMGEDPYLVTMLGAAYVRGLQSAGVLATVKHFAGYSASRAARNHGPVSMGRRELLDVVLPPFESAVVAAGVGSVMNSYADVDGIPAGADPWLLTEVLRDQWGFTGTVVSDYWAVPLPRDDAWHRGRPGRGRTACASGRHRRRIARQDRLRRGTGRCRHPRRHPGSARRPRRAALLTQKAELGLLDADWTPEASVRDAAGIDLDSPENRAIARQLAERSIILLDAGAVLPFLVPTVRSSRGWPSWDRAPPIRRRSWGATPSRTTSCQPSSRPISASRSPAWSMRCEPELPDVEVTHQPGCSVTGTDRSGFAPAVEAARDADLCIAVVGDRAGLFGRGTSGEGCDVEDLRLPGVQADLLDALLDAGTPVVVVVVSGRPYALGDVAGRAAGMVQAFMPGEEGGPAIAGVLSGRISPGGKLPVQIPRHPGGQPRTYLQPPLGGAESAGISSVDPTPLFPFGYGAVLRRIRDRRPALEFHRGGNRRRVRGVGPRTQRRRPRGR